MLIWAVFTLGYLFGVFFSLGVLLKKDEVEEYSLPNNPLNSEDYPNMNPWEIFAQLTKINQPKKRSNYSIISSKIPAKQDTLPEVISSVA